MQIPSIRRLCVRSIILFFLSSTINRKLLCSCSKKSNHVDSTRTQVVVKVGASTNDMKKPVMSVGAESYYDLVTSSDMLVDKSLLLVPIFNNATRIKLITAPQNMGKSINLKMIHFFAQTPRDANKREIAIENSTAYDYFQNGRTLLQKPLISNHKEFIDSHLGKYSVIYVDFGKFKIVQNQSYQDIFTEFKKIVEHIFREHDYLENYWDVLEKNTTVSSAKKIGIKDDRVQIIQFIENKEYNETKWIHSISYLINWLHEYVGKPVIIILDDVDTLISKLYFDPQFYLSNREKKRLKFFHSAFMNATFLHNKNYHVAITSGIFQVEKTACLGHMDDVVAYDIFDAKELYPFYGFDENEVKSLLEKRGLSTEAEVKKWYNGYECLGVKGTLYNPWDIVRYINSGEFGEYWTETGSTRFLDKLCQKYQPVREFITSLMNNGTYTIDKELLKFEGSRCNVAQRLMSKGAIETELDKDKVDVIVAFLYNSGYLSAVNKVENGPKNETTVETVTLRMVNHKTYLQFDRSVHSNETEVMNHTIQGLSQPTSQGVTSKGPTFSTQPNQIKNSTELKNG